MVVSHYGDLVFEKPLEEIDPFVHGLIRREAERQARKIILIPSESICPAPVREALGSVFTSIYAEGYPPKRMSLDPETRIRDVSHELSYYRRYGDRRFYKGCDYVHFLETLAQRRVAECFANRRVGAADIFVNIQPLSGAAANNAVYEAFVEPGDTVMGLSLPHGGHLTHGSEFNRSGKRYTIVPYEVSPRTEKLDYDAIMKLAIKSRPRMIIAGFTSYPWAPDWRKFREIADAVDATLLADISHTAGMTIAGVYPSPVGIADVTTFTTHKTICGPRGAAILTTDEEKAQKIDTAVFPGEQGGPHVNKFAAIAVAFNIARTKSFKTLQRSIRQNAHVLASALQKHGLRLAYGGTDTHLLVIDLNAIKTPTGFSLKGEIAARILDLCGIVVNKNTIPGDATAADASGIRLGTPWISQRGMGPHDMERLARLIYDILTNIHPFQYIGLTGLLPRGKIDLDLLERLKREVAELADSVQAEGRTEKTGYPHFALHSFDRPRRTPLFCQDQAERKGLSVAVAAETALLLDLSDMGVIEVGGDRAFPFLQQLLTTDITELAPGRCTWGLLMDRRGTIIDDVYLLRLQRDRWARDRYWVLTNPSNTERVKAWFRGISDGYILFDEFDIFRKVEGPVVIEDLGEGGSALQRTTFAMCGARAFQILKSAFPELVEVAPGHLWNGRALRGDILISRSPTDSVPYSFLIIVHTRRASPIWRHLQDTGGDDLESGGPEARAHIRRTEKLPIYGAGEGERDGVAFCMGEGRNVSFLSKPYFVGQHGFDDFRRQNPKPEFRYRDEQRALRRTCLYEEHRKHTQRFVPFAGWEMPVWYTSIGEEHLAVRQRAGLFDLSHMGVLEISGEGTIPFLDFAISNYVRWIKDGECQYAYLLDPDGCVIDDIMVYRRTEHRTMLVVNAVNAERDLAWLKALQSREVLTDRRRSDIETPGPVQIRDLKNPSSGRDRRVNMALQGPNSLTILCSLVKTGPDRKTLSRLRKMAFTETEVGGLDVIIARTGYTGEWIGFELFVHPEKAPELWNLLLHTGGKHGVQPIGLGARDSLRTEAGLPLHGHELAGPLNVTPKEAGFAPYVKYHKPYFIGRDTLMERDRISNRQIVRFHVLQKGVRMIKNGSIVANRRTRKTIGTVTSCVLDGTGLQIGLALVEKSNHQEGTRLAIFPEPESTVKTKALEAGERGERVPLHEEAVVISRFPSERLHLEEFREVLEK